MAERPIYRRFWFWLFPMLGLVQHRTFDPLSEAVWRLLGWR